MKKNRQEGCSGRMCNGMKSPYSPFAGDLGLICRESLAVCGGKDGLVGPRRRDRTMTAEVAKG